MEQPRETREDAQDIQRARVEDLPERKRAGLMAHVGPGVITGAADDDPSGIGTYSVAGAQFGYNLLWLVPVCVPLMIVVQEMCARIGLITGAGLAAVIKRHYPKWMLFSCIGLLMGANVVNIYADINVMAATAKMLFSGPMAVWLAAFTIFLVLTQILIPYKQYVFVLRWLCLALFAYVVTGLLPEVHQRWGSVFMHLFTPHWSRRPEFVLTVVGFLGTTISPYLFFWQAGEEVEEEISHGKADRPGHRIHRVKKSEIRAARVDTVTGMLVSQFFTFFIVICAAAALRGHGELQTARDAAAALRPLGASAYWLFALGIIGTGLLAIPTLAGSAAYAVAEAAGWRYGLYRRFRRARGFYITLAAMIVAGYALNFVHSISPIQGLLYSAALNGIVAPPLIVVLLLICNNRKIVGARTNSRLTNAIGWLTVLLMGGAAAVLLWGMATGKA